MIGDDNESIVRSYDIDDAKDNDDDAEDDDDDDNHPALHSLPCEEDVGRVVKHNLKRRRLSLLVIIHHIHHLLQFIICHNSLQSILVLINHHFNRLSQIIITITCLFICQKFSLSLSLSLSMRGLSVRLAARAPLDPRP